MEATFWRNLFSWSLLLNNWLLLVTTIGYFSYYTSTTSTTITTLSSACIGSGLLLSLQIWVLQMFTLTGYNRLLEYDKHI